MQVIHVKYPLKDEITKSNVVLALGFFDGVHLGHQNLIKVAKNIAIKKQLPLMLLTFDRHPREIYQNQKDFSYLDTLSEKAYKMQQLGVDYLVVLDFDQAFSKMMPQTFIQNVIMKLKAETVVVGFDYTYGPKDIANTTTLKQEAKGRFNVVVMPEQAYEGAKIGSTAIRSAIAAGNMELAKDLLGRYYTMSGIVGHGLQNGHKLGFPTVNLIFNEHKVIPKIGVYVTQTKVNDHWYNSMTSVGYNPTIADNKKLLIESNLFNFNQDVYDQPVVIKWLKYLRSEIKFNSFNELQKQLKLDKIAAEKYFRLHSDLSN